MMFFALGQYHDFTAALGNETGLPADKQVGLDHVDGDEDVNVAGLLKGIQPSTE